MKGGSNNLSAILEKTRSEVFEDFTVTALPDRLQGNQKAKVLVVDDDPMVREMISRKLRENGFTCATAAGGDEALNRIRRHSFDLVLLDIRMPEKSGLATLAEIKSQYPDIAVIMVTVVADIDVAISSMREGASDFILKPVDFDILLLSVDRVLEKRRLILENKRYQLYLEQRVAEQAKIIRESFINSVKSLVHALEAKDVYTSGHSQRVTDIATNIAEAMHWDEAQLEKIRLAGILHDIGKIGVPESILNKPGKLEKDEFEIVKTHCEIGERILRSVITDEEILKAIRHHHERYDGTGYPDGLPGDRIPQGARILAAADAYDAMTSDRPYRRAMTHSQACIELEKKSGLQFDPEVASIFLAKVAPRLKLQSP